MKPAQFSLIKRWRILIWFAASVCLLSPLGSVVAQEQEDSSIFAEGQRRMVVIDSGVPMWRFMSRTGSLAFVQFRKHGEESAFAVNVIDWDRFSMKTGWLFISKDSVAFESDESSKRSFDVAKSDVKKLKGDDSFNGQNWLVIKVKGKEKKFMIAFNPTPASRTGVWGAHQKPVFALLEQLFTNYEVVEKEFQEQLAKVSPKPLEVTNKSDQSRVASEPSKVVVQITSEPSGAEIYVDGVFTGSTLSNIALAPGEHTIRVARPGFIDWERKINVEAGSTKTVNAILEKKP